MCLTARTPFGRAQWLERTLAPRLSTRCRGAPRRRGELRKVWDLACGFVQATKNRSPPTLTVARNPIVVSAADQKIVGGQTPIILSG